LARQGRYRSGLRLGVTTVGLAWPASLYLACSRALISLVALVGFPRRLFGSMVVGDTDDMLRGMPVSMTNLYQEDYRTHDEYQYRIKDKVRLRRLSPRLTS
jgi:hypothetical protein